MQVIPITYAINDDVAMRDIASGSLTGTPDYHLIFIKAAFGWVLTGLYRCFGGIDWYGCVFLGMMVLCCGILLERWNSWCIQKGKKPWYIIGWYVIGITGDPFGTYAEFSVYSNGQPFWQGRLYFFMVQRDGRIIISMDGQEAF